MKGDCGCRESVIRRTWCSREEPRAKRQDRYSLLLLLPKRIKRKKKKKKEETRSRNRGWPADEPVIPTSAREQRLLLESSHHKSYMYRQPSADVRVCGHFGVYVRVRLRTVGNPSRNERRTIMYGISVALRKQSFAENEILSKRVDILLNTVN